MPQRYALPDANRGGAQWHGFLALHSGRSSVEPSIRGRVDRLRGDVSNASHWSGARPKHVRSAARIGGDEEVYPRQRLRKRRYEDGGDHASEPASAHALRPVTVALSGGIRDR